jgi:DNA polymerase III subunit delta
MAKSKAPSVLDIHKDLKKGKLLPVYYIFGEDSFNIDTTLKLINDAINPLIKSDFDKETFYGENKNLSEVLGIVTAFPFGSEKKLVVFKEFEKVKDKKLLKDYSTSPAEFSVLVLIHNGTISNLTSEPYSTLINNNCLFEAKELKGKNLLKWLVTYTESCNRIISEENAQMLIDMVGESRNLLESQLEKILIYQNDKKELTTESIQQVSSMLKQFTIFDLQNAIGERNKPKALQVAYNLLNNGSDPVFIIVMLNKYFTGLAKIPELKSKNIPDQQAARIVGTHPFFYKEYVKARNQFSDSQLIEVFQALLKADITIKTTNDDDKTIVTILISELLASNQV